MHLKPYAFQGIICRMPWTVLFHAEFDAEFRDLPDGIQDELLKRLRVLGEFGPTLGRPNVDTLNESSFPNMKECGFGWTAFGALPLLLIRNDKPSCLSGAIRRACVKVRSIKN